MRHVFHCPLRWGDMDAQGHVNNVAWVDVLQQARVDFLLRGPAAHLLAAGVLVVSHQVEHRAAVVVDSEPVRVEVWLAAVGAARFEVAYELTHRDVLVAVARTVVVSYDLAAGVIRRLTDDERTALAGAVEATEPLRPVAADSESRPIGEIELAVRWSDLDSYGHVNNVEFVEYVQQARVDLLGWAAAGIDGGWVVARQDLRYLVPMAFRLEPYRVRLGLVRVGRSSLTLTGDVVDPAVGQRPETVFARATTVVVATGDDGRPRPLDPEAVQRLVSGGHSGR